MHAILTRPGYSIEMPDTATFLYFTTVPEVVEGIRGYWDCPKCLEDIGKVSCTFCFHVPFEGILQ